MSGLPVYVPRLGHGEVAMLPPGAVERATVVMFAVRTDPVPLQATVDEVLTSRGGPRYEVAGGTILLCFLDAPRLTSTTQSIGYVPDREVAVWAPLVERADGGRLRLVVWMPYLWVNTDIAMATGREVWGFPKGIGSYEPPEAGGPYVLRTRIFRRFAPDTAGQQADLIRVDAASHPAGAVWHDVEAAARGLADALGWAGARRHLSLGDEVRLAVDLVEIALSRRIPVVNLKQFRDATVGTRACYQAIIGSDLRLTGFHGGGLLAGDHVVSVVPCDSHDLIGDLGLPGTRFPARFGAWVTMDFLADPGAPVWEASGASAQPSRGPGASDQA